MISRPGNCRLLLLANSCSDTIFCIIPFVESAFFSMCVLSYFGSIESVDKAFTFRFAYINFVWVSTILILHEQDCLWKSRPCRFVSIVILAEVLFVSAIRKLGILAWSFGLLVGACSLWPRNTYDFDNQSSAPHTQLVNFKATSLWIYLSVTGLVNDTVDTGAKSAFWRHLGWINPIMIKKWRLNINLEWSRSGEQDSRPSFPTGRLSGHLEHQIIGGSGAKISL